MVKCHPCLERFHQSCIQADKTFYPPSGTVLHALRNMTVQIEEPGQLCAYILL